jgi:hypothetical protein
LEKNSSRGGEEEDVMWWRWRRNGRKGYWNRRGSVVGG